MGSFSELYINGISLFLVKNTFNESHLKLFSPLELIKKETTDPESYRQVLFRTTVKEARIRLEIQGYNEVALKEYFRKGLTYQQINLQEPEDEYDYPEYEYYRDLSYDNYCNSLKQLLAVKGLDVFNEGIIDSYKDTYSKAIIEKLSKGYYLNPFFYNEIYENEEYLINELMDLYLCLICSDKDAIVEYNLSETIYGGWIKENEVLDFYNNFMDTTIIITEGKTDIKVLSKSLGVLYPGYKHLFTFFDFENYRADGGTSYLTKLIKSFSAAKIKNRIIAVFDNDTAAESELKSLESIPILDNIRIMQLPHLEFCTSYPTMGPTGEENLDINGLAVSIELFFGDDILKNEGDYRPIQWTGYFDKLNKYQGSITNKSEVIRMMETKLENPDPSSQDWSKLEYLWETIFQI